MDDAVAIRPARASEAQQLQAIGLDADEAYRATGHPDLAGEPFPIDVLARAIDAGRVHVAALAPEDRPVGWIIVSRAAPEPCIAQVSVARSHARRGIGTALVEHVVDRLRDDGHESVVLNTQSDVPFNAPWYERLGFRAVRADEWTADMRTITAEQTADGLDWTSRVHMRRQLR